MNYHNITKDDLRNGDGLRVVLWLAGCDHHCPGCQNPITWDPDGGLKFDSDALQELLDDLDHDYISGITFSGGDPLHPNNRDYVTTIASFVKELMNKTVWIYTGYLWEQVKDLPVMQYVDVLVDGPFMQDLADVKYHWAGSTNQRVIDVQKSLKTCEVVLWNTYQTS